MRLLTLSTFAASGALVAAALTAPLVASAAPAPARDAGTASPRSSAYSISGTLAGSLTTESGKPCAGGAKPAPAASTSECEVRVVAILPDGRAFGSAPAGSRKFTISIAASAAERSDLTLHLVRANGAYLGPVVLDTVTITEKSGRKTIKKYQGAMSLGSLGSAKSTSLGTVTIRKAGVASAYADVTAEKLKVGSVRSFMCDKGVPYGAGKAGYVKVPSGCKPKAAKSARIRVPQPRVDDDEVPASCKAFFNSKGATAMSEACWNALAQGFGQQFTAACPRAQTAGKKLSQMPAGCRELITGGGGGGGGGGDSCAAQSSGGDQDGDGIPSAVDVDDNGNGIVDVADKATDGNCTIEPYKSVRGEIGGGELPANYAAVQQGLFASRQAFQARLKDLLSRSFSIAYYVYDERFFPGATKANGIIPAIWVTCTGVVWCDPQTSKAVNFTNVEAKNAAGVTAPGNDNMNRFSYASNEPWAGQSTDDWCLRSGDNGAPCWSSVEKPMRFGSVAAANCGALAYQPAYSPAGIPAAARNFLWQTVCQDKGGTRAVHGASIDPRLGELPGQSGPAVLSGLDLLTLNYLSSGGVSGVATTIGSYPITVPMVARFNGTAVDYEAVAPLGSRGNPVIVSGASPQVRVDFYRPQREQFPGETGSTGYHDMYNLSYGLEMEYGDAQFGCGAGSDGAQGEMPSSSVTSAYSQPVAGQWTVNSSNGEYAWFLAPLRDAVVDSAAAQPGTQTLSLAVDLVGCIQDRAPWLLSRYGIDVAELDGGEALRVNLTARGEAKTGGTDTSVLTFHVSLPDGTLRSVAS